MAGPNWDLVNSSVKYVDFCLYVKELFDYLAVWSADPSPMIVDSGDRLFGSKFSVSSKTEFALFKYAKSYDQALVQNSLKLITSHCLEVPKGHL